MLWLVCMFTWVNYISLIVCIFKLVHKTKKCGYHRNILQHILVYFPLRPVLEVGQYTPVCILFFCIPGLFLAYRHSSLAANWPLFCHLYWLIWDALCLTWTADESRWWEQDDVTKSWSQYGQFRRFLSGTVGWRGVGVAPPETDLSSLQKQQQMF